MKILYKIIFSSILLFSAENIIPEEVAENLDFFKDFELFQYLELFENDDLIKELDSSITSNDVIKTTQSLILKNIPEASTKSVKNVEVSTFTGRGYEKK